MGGLIIPKNFIYLLDAPVIFLAGPIRGAPLWQDDAVNYLLSKHPSFFVVSPRRDIREKIADYVLKGNNNHFSRQRAWERHYLDKAGIKGSVMIWLPGEIEHNCEKSYGAMTRVELGHLMTRSRYDSAFSWCIGSDGKFSDLDTIKYDLSVDAPNKKIHSTLEQTCDEAMRLALLKF